MGKLYDKRYSRVMVWCIARYVVRVSDGTLYDKLCLIYYGTIYDRMLPYCTLYDKWSGT